ncbi:hypothetical protein [Rhodococcus spongiicola]|nr:hypothetical protein [Rhodococcus spongiicola]
MDPIEAAAIRDEGYNPDDPRVREAIDLVRWELAMHRYYDDAPP